MDSKENISQPKVEIEEEVREIRRIRHLKDQLLQTISHELRSNLSLLQEPIKKIEINNPSSEKQLKVIRKKLQRLGQLVDQLTDISQLIAHHTNLKTKEVEVGTFLKRYIAFFESKAQQKNICLKATLPDQEIIHTLDPDKFEKLIIILIANAIKFTPTKGTVHIELEEHNQYLCIGISDTGKGISEKELDNLFYRSGKQSPRKKQHGGLGIKLSIVDRYMEMHGGDMRIESEKEQGTVVKLRFPKQAEQINKAELLEKGLTDGDGLISSRNIDKQSETGLKPKGSFSATILVVEDNRDMRDYIVSLLNEKNISVETASNGKEGRKQLSIIEPDLIISDIMMPQMDGFEFVRMVRQQPQYQFTPIILISAKAEEEARIYGYKIGISDYLVKPFSETELKARVQNLLEQKREREKYLNNFNDGLIAETGNSLVNDLKQYVESRIKNETITIRELSQSANTSRRQLYRDLKALTGFTPAEFVREVKLRKARNMLERNYKMTVAEAANAVGYNTVAHFSKIFKNRFGRNPSEYL